jgi:hypothetical protein
MTRGPASRVIGALVRELTESHNRARWQAFESLVARTPRPLPACAVAARQRASA